jgi:hypothetical protein
MTQRRGRSLATLGFAALLCTVRLDAQTVDRVGPEFQVNTYTSSHQDSAAVAIESDGDFVVAWRSFGQDGSGDAVMARRWNAAGTPQATEFVVNARTSLNQNRPSVAVLGSGGFVVVWMSYGGADGSDTGVFARRFNAAGLAQAGEFLVNSYTTGFQQLPKVAGTAAGSFVVSWSSQEQDGSSAGIFARRFTSAGTALGVEFQVNTYTPGQQHSQSVAIDGEGDFVIGWASFGQDGYNYGDFARRFNAAGTPQAAEFLVNSYTNAAQFGPLVAMNDDGRFVMVWSSDHRDNNFDVFGQRFDANGVPQAAEFQVNSYTVEDQLAYGVGMEADGSFVVAWPSQTQEGDDFGIFARRFDSAGAPLTTEFQVNSYTPDTQIDAALAMNEAGRFVVAWRSDYQDGGQYGVFAQRFAKVAVLDIDGDGSVQPLTDGLLVLRFLFGFNGTTLTAGAIGPNCTRCNAATIEPYLSGLV